MFEKQKVVALEKREVKLLERVTKLEQQKHTLLDTNEGLRVSNKRLQIKKEMEEEQIAHKLTMREEVCDLENLKKLQAKQDKCAEEIRKVKDDYRNKLETQVVERVEELRSMYSEILSRLPNININAKKL